MLAVDEEHSDEFVDGRFRPSSGPTGIKVDFLADTPPSEVFSFYKQTLSPPGEVIRRDDHRLTLAFGPQYPPWAPRPMHILYAAVQSYLFATADGIVVPIPRLVSGQPSPLSVRPSEIQALKHIPNDTFRYWVRVEFAPGEGRK